MSSNSKFTLYELTGDGRLQLFAVDWPQSLGILAGFRWVFQEVDSATYLVSEESDDDFPHGAMNWIEIHFSTFMATNAFVCDEDSIRCSGSYSPTNAPAIPTTSPSFKPSLRIPPSTSPTQTPSRNI